MRNIEAELEESNISLEKDIFLMISRSCISAVA